MTFPSLRGGTAFRGRLIDDRRALGAVFRNPSAYLLRR